MIESTACILRSSLVPMSGNVFSISGTTSATNSMTEDQYLELRERGFGLETGSI